MIHKTCFLCKKDFIIKNHLSNSKKFCSAKCRNKNRTEYYKSYLSKPENKDRKKELDKIWRVKNQEKHKKQQKEWKLKNKDRINKIRRERYREKILKEKHENLYPNI